MAHKCRRFIKSMRHINLCGNYKRKQKETPMCELEISTLVFNKTFGSTMNQVKNILESLI